VDCRVSGTGPAGMRMKAESARTAAKSAMRVRVFVLGTIKLYNIYTGSEVKTGDFL
jgi:hypothetical protein